MALRGTPTRKDSIVIPGAGSASRLIRAPKNLNNDPAMSVLNGAIQTLNLVNNLVPLEIGKGVLASVSGILGIIKVQLNILKAIDTYLLFRIH
ncbi:hypothetical protein H2248_005275 [Termitomyces sp. 'cryptogamus']|nr:hypothetical protein H2248_005275 [Termitomyces sp. 'cryptogamus']